MKVYRHQCRAVYAALVIVAYFIPAYSNISAFRFLILAVRSGRTDSEIAFLDLVVILLPLLLVPAAATLILIKAVSRKPLNSLLLSLPFFSVAFFFVILSLDMTRQANNSNVLQLLAQMKLGFYVAALASLLLLLSYSRREVLNLSSGRR